MRERGIVLVNQNHRGRLELPFKFMQQGIQAAGSGNRLGARRRWRKPDVPPSSPWFNVRFHTASMPIGVQPFQVLEKLGLQPCRRIRGRHRHVEANNRMYPGPANIVLDGGAPEQVNPLPRIGIKSTAVARTQLGQVALKIGLKGGYQQGLAKTTGSGQEGILRMQVGSVAASRNQQLAQVVRLVNVQPAVPANGTELRPTRVQRGQLHVQ